MPRHFSGILLKKAREAKELTHNDLAAATGRSPYVIRSYEYEMSQPSASVLGALADRLGCSTDDLYEVHAEEQVAA